MNSERIDEIKPKIIVVEDETIVAYDLAGRLDSLGYEVVGIFSNGEELLEQIKDLSPDLILMDIVLKGELDGIQTAYEIKKNHYLPIIYLTAHSDTATLERAKLSEPHGYILKPFEEQELRSIIEMALYKHLIEKELRDSEERYRIVAEQTGQLVYDYNLLTGNIKWSGAIYEITGFTSDEFNSLGIEQWTELIYSSDRKNAGILQSNFFISPKHYSSEYRLHKKDGSYFFAEDNGVIIDDDFGKPVRILGTIEDISEKVKARKVIQQNEARLESMIKLYKVNTDSLELFYAFALKEANKITNSRFGFFGSIKNGIVQNPITIVDNDSPEISPISFNILDLPKSFTTSLNEAVGNSSVNKFSCNNEQIFINRQEIDLFNCLLIPIIDSGRLVMISGFINKPEVFNEDDIQQMTIMISEIWQIIKSKQAEKLLVESEIKFRSIVENSHSGIALLTEDYKITYANNKLCEITGSLTSELVELDFCDLFGINRDIIGSEGFSEILYLNKRNQLKTLEIKLNTIKEAENEVKIISQILDITDKKVIENELKESEKRFRGLAEMLPQPIFETDTTGRFTYVNKQALKLYGYTKEEFEAGRNLFEMIVPEEHSRAIQNIERIIKGERREGIEYTSRRKSGETFVTIISSTPIIKDNKFCGFRGVITDISERIKSEEALRNSENRLRQVIDLVPHFIFAKDIDGRFILANKAVAEAYGTTTSEMLGKLDAELLKNEDEVISFRKYDLEVIQSGKEQIINEEKITDFRGNARYLQTLKIPFTFSGSDKPAVLGVSIDISSRKQYEERLRKVNRAIEQSPVLIMITDKYGNIEYVNPKFSEVTGYKLHEILGKNPRILKSGRTSNETYLDLWKTIQSGLEWRGEILNKKKNGNFYWESSSITGIKNEKGVITHFVAVKEDITEKKRLIEELRETMDRAEESSALKSNLIGNMSHEFRTPLVGILGFTQFLSESISEPAQLEMLSRISKSAKRLTTTLNGVLQFAQLESNEITPEFQELSIDKYITYIYQPFAESAKDKGLYFNLEIESTGLNAYTDDRLFNVVFTNILDNALKFTNEGGITVRVSREINDINNWIKVVVNDTGIGISDDHLNIVFKEFRQVSEGVSRRYEGTGLGLNICKRMMTLLNGDIDLTSKENKGTTLIVRLPSAKEQATEVIDYDEAVEVKAIEEIIELKSNQEKPTILLVEDNKINQEVIIAYLRNLYKVECADDGEAAISLCQQNGYYKTILMDINLGGGINGIEATQELKKIKGYESIPVIAVTGYTMQQQKKALFEFGFSAHLSKPFEKKELVDLINSLLS